MTDPGANDQATAFDALPMVELPPYRRRRWRWPRISLRPRVSLRSWFAMTAIVTLVISNVVMVWRLNEAEKSLDRIRNETGNLAITDPTQAHVALTEKEENWWKWRVWLPDGVKYQIHQRIGMFPHGTSGSGAGWSIPPGEHWITARYDRGANAPRFSVRVDDLPRYITSWYPHGTPVTTAVAQHPAGINGGHGWIDRCAGDGAPEQFPFGKSIPLLEYQQGDPTANGFHTPSGPTFGVLLWIEPIP